MKASELKAGDWFLAGDGESLFLCVGPLQYVDKALNAVFYVAADYEVTPLPLCDSWDWEPPKESSSKPRTMNREIWKTQGEHIRSYRLGKAIPLREFASEYGLEPSVLLRMENGHVDNTELAQKLDVALNFKEEPQSYAARQAAWVEANGVKVGSRVKILREPKTKEDGWGDFAVAGMGNYVGHIGEVLGLSVTSGVYVDGATRFWFPYFVLEPVAEHTDESDIATLVELIGKHHRGDHEEFKAAVGALHELLFAPARKLVAFPLEPVEPAAQPPLQVRDLVEAVPPFALACGSGVYRRGVVAHIDPLIVISEAGDMLWRSTVSHENLRAVGKSDDKTYAIVSKRLMDSYPDLIAEVPPPSEEAKPSPPTHHTAKDFLGKWCPDYDPITLAPFFMWIEDEGGQWVPTYGGPYDSYTLSQPCELKDGTKRVDIEYHRKRFCHDEGCWRESETLCERVVSEEMLIALGVWDEKEVPPPSESPVMETPDKVATPEPEREATTEKAECIAILRRVFEYATRESEIASKQSAIATERKDYRASDRHAAYSKAMSKVRGMVLSMSRDKFLIDLRETCGVRESEAGK